MPAWTRKYSYRELAALPRSQEIPAEVNAQVVKLFEVFRSKELIDLLDNARKLRVFGLVSITDNQGKTWAEAELHKGVIIKVWRHTHAKEGQGFFKPAGPYTLELRQSDMNPVVTMKKESEA